MKKKVPPSSSAITVLIVDDHPVVRGGLEAMLRYEPGFAIADCVASGEEALAACRKTSPQVVLLDVRMPGCDGFQTLSELLKHLPRLRVLMLAGVPLKHEVERARELGACGYQSKSADQSVLIEAIREVQRGGTAFMQITVRGSAADGAISPREHEVLEYLGRGLSDEDIGSALGIGTQTVKSHVKALLAKLHVANRTEAVARGYVLGLLHG